MTPEKEMEIRTTWGDYLLAFGRSPGFPGGIARLHRRELTPLDSVTPIDPMGAAPEIDYFVYRREVTAIRRVNYRNAHEVTVSCEGVVVLRNWELVP